MLYILNRSSKERGFESHPAQNNLLQFWVFLRGGYVQFLFIDCDFPSECLVGLRGTADAKRDRGLAVSGAESLNAHDDQQRLGAQKDLTIDIRKSSRCNRN